MVPRFEGGTKLTAASKAVEHDLGAEVVDVFGTAAV